MRHIVPFVMANSFLDGAHIFIDRNKSLEGAGLPNRIFAGAIAVLVCGQASSALAVAPAAQPTQAGASAAADPAVDIPDPAAVQMPDLGSAPPTGGDGAFDKYYFFHRNDTSFASALADLRECDDFARGLTRLFGAGSRYGDTIYPRSDGSIGADAKVSFGNPAVSVLGDALLSADARKARRTNMRRCMHYKGYQRFGIDKALWQKFNFEEGYRSIAEADRQRMLAQQAKAASTPGIERQDLGL